MSICAPCVAAADGTLPDRYVCPVCTYECYVGPLDDPSDPPENAPYHHPSYPAPRGWNGYCKGSLFGPLRKVSGHDDCTGCACQHKPKGSWHGGE